MNTRDHMAATIAEAAATLSTLPDRIRDQAKAAGVDQAFADALAASTRRTVASVLAIITRSRDSIELPAVHGDVRTLPAIRTDTINL